MSNLTLFYNENFISNHTVDRETIFIGQGEDCSIKIDSLGQSIGQKHALIRRQERTLTIAPVSTRTTVKINNQTIKKPTALKPGDMIQIGQYTLVLSQPGNSSQYQKIPDNKNFSSNKIIPHSTFDQIIENIEMLPTAYIQIISGEHIGKVIALQRSLTRLGLNGNECAVIARRKDGFYLSHLEGSLPPKIDNQSIGNNSKLLHEGVIISMGNTRMRFHEEISQPAAKQTDKTIHGLKK